MDVSALLRRESPASAPRGPRGEPRVFGIAPGRLALSIHWRGLPTHLREIRGGSRRLTAPAPLSFCRKRRRGGFPPAGRNFPRPPSCGGKAQASAPRGPREKPPRYSRRLRGSAAGFWRASPSLQSARPGNRGKIQFLKAHAAQSAHFGGLCPSAFRYNPHI